MYLPEQDIEFDISTGIVKENGVCKITRPDVLKFISAQTSVNPDLVMLYEDETEDCRLSAIRLSPFDNSIIEDVQEFDVVLTKEEYNLILT